MLGSSESRRRKKDPERDRTSPKSKDEDREKRKERHKSKSARSSRKTSSSASKDDDREPSHERPSKERTRTSSSSTPHTPKSHRMAVVPEMDRRGSLGSPNGSRTSLSYPTLSKTHAKENIYSREDTADRKAPLTPEATDIGDGENGKDKPESQKQTSPAAPTRAPPSPPLTATTAADLRKTASANSMRRKEALHREMQAGRGSVDSGTRLTPEPRTTASRSSLRQTDAEGAATDLTSTIGGSQPSTVKIRAHSPRYVQPKTGSASPAAARPPKTASPAVRMASRQDSEITQSTDSDATPVAPSHGSARQRCAGSPTNSEISPPSVIDSSPRTPTQSPAFPSMPSGQKVRPPTVEIVSDPSSRSQSVDTAYSATPLTPAPPPPPPPPTVTDPPRVDYLLRNGGLSRPVHRSLLAAVDGMTPMTGYAQYQSPRMSDLLEDQARSFFKPLQMILDDYNLVIDKNGSLAVATGYQSVARRLLDRLETVFARDITLDYCDCLMCLDEPGQKDQSNVEYAGESWGSILELVSGRVELPSWPPFDNTTADGLGIRDLQDPCQQIDVDVPEEYRDHYARQSRKTKATVQSWLSSQKDTAPDEIDDETLTFAMLTRLEQVKRPLFYGLLYGLEELPTPKSQPEPEDGMPRSIEKAAIALQRLYRLPTLPREQLVVMWLIRNPTMHDLLHSLAGITKQEWEILISGRFDGFLWSGADEVVSSPPGVDLNPPRLPSRGPPGTFSPPLDPVHRLSFRPAPIQMDEETEIAVLAEVEREIWKSMEELENAFEHLHKSAELVRIRLRHRSAGLSMAAQARRGDANPGVFARTDTPASAFGHRSAAPSDSLEDLRSEIGPDDSASNVSHNRRGGAHRRRARHTPAPVEEEDEGEAKPPTLAQKIRRKF